MMKYYLLLAGWFISLAGIAQYSEMSEYASGILNQEILSQQMVKDYMMIGLNLKKYEAREDLDETVSRYEEFRLTCEDADLSGPLLASMEKSNDIWMKFRLIITDEVSKEGAFQLLKTNSSLLFAANSCLTMLQKPVDGDTMKAYYLSMHMQMLSQRLASYYFMYAWGVKKEATLRYLSDASVEFERDLNELSSLNINSIKVKSKLMSLKNEWDIAKEDIGNLGMGRLNNRRLLDITNSFSKSLSMISDWCLQMESRSEVTANGN